MGGIQREDETDQDAGSALQFDGNNVERFSGHRQQHGGASETVSEHCRPEGDDGLLIPGTGAAGSHRTILRKVL